MAAPKGKPTGRPSKLTPAVCEEICARLADGESLRSICLSDHLPEARTVHRWLVTDDAFRQQYARAREIQADTLFDECLDIADDSTGDRKVVGRDGEEREVMDSEFAQRSRIRIDTRKWMAGKLRPKVYGDKIDVEHSGTLDVTETVTVYQLPDNGRA